MERGTILGVNRKRATLWPNPATNLVSMIEGESNE